MTAPRILVLNAGSSSLKAGLIELPGTTLGRAEVGWSSDASLRDDRAADVAQVLRKVGIGAIGGAVRPGLDAVGYRVVHGGARFSAPTLIDDAVISGIEDVRGLAPLHTDVALETIEAGRALLPDVPHVASFDTAFHATLAPDAYRYPVPESWYREWGVRRYGFHGLSVAWSVRRAGDLLGREVADLSMVVAHLGSGCSVTAVDGGCSVDTSMGLTPLEGLMMGTRSGSIDPGVLLRLLAAGSLDADGLADALDHESGLLGVSGSSSDMRQLQLAAGQGDERATLAIDMFVRRTAAWIASMASALPRLDALIFTGGIGENAVAVRRRIVGRLGVLGVAPLPDSAAIAGDGRLDAEAEHVAILRIEAREDLVIASETAAIIER
ncbi:MAG: acetate/propionate family kinase [Chloroflexota bacterium]